MIDSEFEKIYLQRDRTLQLFFYGYSFDELTVILMSILIGLEIKNFDYK